jgi:(p)ppGpp synthase/HD superfamily hydrolase
MKSNNAEKKLMREKEVKLLEDMLALAMKAHRGQRDKSGEPYILHPLRMMLRSQRLEEKLTSLLHDVVEDTDYSLKDLRKAGCPEDVLAAVDHLTRREEETYEQFVERALSDPLARKVKIKDLEDNMNLLRYSELDDKALGRLAKYHRAWKRAQKVLLRKGRE